MIEPDDLIEIHRLHELKYRYIRALDTQQWDLMARCFAEDARVWYAGGKVTERGRDRIVDLLRRMLPPSVVSSHLVMHPELELTSATTAKGIWRMQDTVIFTAPNPAFAHIAIKGGEVMSGAAYYHEEYVKLAGEWKIASLGYVRIYELMDRGDIGRLELAMESSRGMRAEPG